MDTTDSLSSAAPMSNQIINPTQKEKLERVGFTSTDLLLIPNLPEQKLPDTLESKIEGRNINLDNATFLGVRKNTDTPVFVTADGDIIHRETNPFSMNKYVDVLPVKLDTDALEMMLLKGTRTSVFVFGWNVLDASIQMTKDSVAGKLEDCKKRVQDNYPDVEFGDQKSPGGPATAAGGRRSKKSKRSKKSRKSRKSRK